MAYTASFLTVNGLDVPVMTAGQRRTDPDRWGRGNGAAYSGTTYAKRRQFALETPPVPPLEAQALSGWVRGLGHHFTFEWTDDHRATTQFTLYSTDGGAAMSGGSAATTSTKFGSYALLVAGNDVHTATVLFGSEAPYSFSVWRNQLSANVWELCSAAHDGATTRYYAGADGTGATTAFAWSVLSASDGYLRVGLEGQNPAGSSSTCLYDGLMILPFSLTTPQLAARVARLNAEPPFPLVAVGGHWTQSVPEIACKGFVKDYPVQRVVLNGRWYDNARQVVGTLIESHELTAETVLPVPTLEDLILADPDLLLYYPLTDASNPGTVADLGPGGYDLTVFNEYAAMTWGAPGPTAQVPKTYRLDGDWSLALYAGTARLFMARPENVGPTFPQGSFSISFIGNPGSFPDQPSWPYTAVPFSLGAYGIADSSRPIFWGSSYDYVDWQVCGVTSDTLAHPDNGVPNSTPRHYVLVFDQTLGTYGRHLLYLNGTLYSQGDLVTPHNPPSPSKKHAIIVGMTHTALPSDTSQFPTKAMMEYSQAWNGPLSHVVLIGRALSAADALALAQAAGFA